MFAEYRFQTTDKLERNVLIAVLQGYDFNGFIEESDCLVGYVDNSVLLKDEVDAILAEHKLNYITYEYKEIEDTNWNQTWESSFSPVIIGDVCIRASFHPKSEVKFDIVIDPKMSFGTGHHPTTELMVKKMLTMDFKDKDVLDIGSGTGVLAILASKLGAKNIDALDNEEWAFENTIENLGLNDVSNVNPILGDMDHIPTKKYDIILANINLNVISQNLLNWSNLLADKGVIILSGLLESDENHIIKKKHDLLHKETARSNGWILIQLTNFQ